MTQPKYKSGQWTIPAGQVIEIARQGDFLVCLDATDRFVIAFDDNPETDFQKGLTFRPETRFYKVRLVNRSGTDINVELGFGQGDVRDARLVVAGPVDTSQVSADQLKHKPVLTVAGGANAIVAPANSARAEIGIRNLSTSETVWIQGAPVGAPEGFPLEGKEVVILTTRDAVSVYNASGVPVDLAAFETEYSA